MKDNSGKSLKLLLLLLLLFKKRKLISSSPICETGICKHETLFFNFLRELPKILPQFSTSKQALLFIFPPLISFSLFIYLFSIIPNARNNF